MRSVLRMCGFVNLVTNKVPSANLGEGRVSDEQEKRDLSFLPDQQWLPVAETKHCLLKKIHSSHKLTISPIVKMP